ncbi:Uncharacterised protein [Mesomycoplasma hyorhinis]|nr:Uncharacterised protein [Mesomycoplasma hyorhinis]
MNKILKNITKPIKTITKLKAKKAPRRQAAPFPPLNLK